MTNRTTSLDRTEDFVQQMTDQMGQLARTLSTWVQAEVFLMHTSIDKYNHILAHIAATARQIKKG